MKKTSRRRLGRRVLSLLLAAVMCLSLPPVPVSAGADAPMAFYYDGHRIIYGGEYDYGTTDGYLEQDSDGKVKLSLSGGVPEGNTITEVYIVTADKHERKGKIYPKPSGATGGLEGNNGIWVQNVILSLAVGSYQTEFVTKKGKLYSVDFEDGGFSVPGVVQVVGPGEAPGASKKPEVDISGVKRTVNTGTKPVSLGTIEATALNGGKLTYTVVNAPEWLSVDKGNGKVSGTPKAAGVYSLGVYATETTDSGSFTSDTVYVTIRVTDPKVTFTFSNKLNENMSNTLTVRQGDTVVAENLIGSYGNSKGVEVYLPGAGSYTATVTGTYWTSYGEQIHTYVDAQEFSAEDTNVALTVTPSDLRFVIPNVTVTDGYCGYYCEWYKANEVTAENLIHTGYSLLCGSETYVRAVPYHFEYVPSGLVEVTDGNPQLTLNKRKTYTVKATLKDSAGNPISGSGMITVSYQSENYRDFYDGHTDENGEISITGVPMGDDLTITAVFKAYSSRYVSATGKLSVPDLGDTVYAGNNGVVTLNPRQGYITVPQNVAYGTSLQIKKGDTVLPASMSCDGRNSEYRLYFEDTEGLNEGDTLTVDLNSWQWMATTTVKLDKNKNGVLEAIDIIRQYRTNLEVTGSKDDYRKVCMRVFDSEGSPIDNWMIYDS
ncbi:MAG: putative Ig domain-containing protein, partial [Lachnospiraceae bacterium]|nr:putative Ig domain-containing protein [Lachnospiraceae bacterium]